ncbi:LOW QUALITY PROTEIN: ATP-dependent RNA helicase DHX58 [Falco biarmicus]|uniref:LOW QUALITY PROTEIN: ATP-dependent RNA helicase DHX58 n=1 Tax=Falco biarmicus TaxID=345155 RepID=UPI001886A3D8|nr:probable ATP-dependent RNA helicase DHX58 isoform X2 [Falco rusticolus]XP_055553310.1 ATP-dependent RNA helicase DHX58 isoform X1 [Falco cherrug]XP_056218451.1 LOW QUALITY PROTEIN: ATP-dependent RNA helicase DHX58 [Falco biarmicus]
MELRGYQLEAVAPALGGCNTIIWLPTGAGKTRAAVYVCQQHLESRVGGRVAVLVNKVHLVDQHAKKEFHALQDTFRVTAISGDSSQKSFFACMVKQSDVVICTAQILHNALVSEEEDMHVELTDFSLLVIDECHHTQKEAVYNKIMLNYLQRKLSGQQDLPQVLGLTASPGTGGATSFEGAVEHILQICANLDVEKIASAQEEAQHLQSHVPQPTKQYDLCQERAQDPFGEQLKEMMEQIQQYMEMPGLPQDFGTQIYEQHIVELEKRGAETFCRKMRVCALHLRKYNDALLINDTVRMIDAFQCLQQFYATERDTKDPTEQFLTALFEENRATLRALAGDQRYENPRLGKLEEILQEHFQPLGTSRGIVFTKTRQSAHSLLSWLQDTAALCGQHIRAAVLTGAGYSNQTRHMTQNEQQDVINLFRKGALNLLFSTSVAEEGLDIPECNIVVRYGLMTNEIAMMQARGRARAENSVYSVLAKANSREVFRELLNEDLVELMERAIRAVQAMPEQEYRLKISELQRIAVASWLMKEARISERRQLHDPDAVYLYCVNCNMAVCRGSDIRTVEGMHHVNINPNFGLYYRVSSGKIQFQRAFKDWEPGCRIMCSECSQEWGMEMIYRQVKLPILSIKNFVVETPAEKKKYKKWSSVTFPVKEFDYVEYCSSIHGQLL